MLTAEQATLLARMRADTERAGAPYCAWLHWQYVGRLFQAVFDSEGVGLAEEQFFNEHFASYPPGHSNYFHFACCALYRYLQTRDRWGILERVHSTLPDGSPRRSTIEDHNYSWDSLMSAETLIGIAEVQPAVLEPGFVLADLGAGWGRIGAAYKQANPRGTYLVFDLPETLLISSTYLPQVLPNERFHFYDETSMELVIGRRMVSDDSTWLMGARCLSCFENGSVDCMVNIASLAEMPIEDQHTYWNVFSHVAAGGLVYNLQHDSGGHIHRPDWEQLYHRHVGWSGVYYEELFKLP